MNIHHYEKIENTIYKRLMYWCSWRHQFTTASNTWNTLDNTIFKYVINPLATGNTHASESLEYLEKMIRRYIKS